MCRVNTYYDWCNHFRYHQYLYCLISTLLNDMKIGNDPLRLDALRTSFNRLCGPSLSLRRYLFLIQVSFHDLSYIFTWFVIMVSPGLYCCLFRMFYQIISELAAKAQRYGDLLLICLLCSNAQEEKESGLSLLISVNMTSFYSAVIVTLRFRRSSSPYVGQLYYWSSVWCVSCHD